MKRFAWSPALVIALLGAIAVPDSACTLVVGGDDGGNPLTDDSGSAQDVATTGDTGTQVDTGVQADTGTQPDAGAQAEAGDGGSCSVTVDTGSAACDQCVDSSCCAQLVMCDGEVTDASTTECEDIASCYSDCMSPPATSGVDAGSPAECSTECIMGHSTQSQTDFLRLTACENSPPCNTPCQ
jgi:hypothetical protein